MIDTDYINIGTTEMIDTIFNSVLEDIGIVDDYSKVTVESAKIADAICNAIDTYLIYHEDILGMASDGLVDADLRSGLVEIVGTSELEAVVYNLIDNDYQVTIN